VYREKSIIAWYFSIKLNELRYGVLLNDVPLNYVLLNDVLLH